MKKSVGRPVEKENRTKVGFSLDGKYCEMLNALSKQQGKTKSRIIEEAIASLYDKEHINIMPTKTTFEEEQKSTSIVPLPQNTVVMPENQPKELIEMESKDKDTLQFDTEQMITESLKKIEKTEKALNNGKIEKSEEEMRDLARKNAFESLRSIFK